MKLYTETGSIYLIEDNTLTRLSEKPVYSYRLQRYEPSMVFDHVRIINMDTPAVGQRCLFMLCEGPLNISRIERIEE